MKKIVLTMAALSAISLSISAQVSTGDWDVTGSGTGTTTSSAVIIGAAAGTSEAWMQVSYCDDQVGLLISRYDCGFWNLDPNDFINSTYDGNMSTLGIEPAGGGGGPVVFTPPISYLLTPYNSSQAKPLVWARQQNHSSLLGTSPSGPFTSRFMVTPYGRSGFNIENPRATLDIKSVGLRNDPALIVGRQQAGTTDRTQHIHFVPILDENGYNEISHRNDLGMFFTDGLGADGCNDNGSLVIAPWTASGSCVGGIRINNLGNVEIHGEMRSTKVVVDVQWWCDFVFGEDYALMALEDVEQFIKANKHLPGVPSEKELKKNGMDVADMQAIHMKKIEELTLYVIELKKEIDVLKAQIKK